MQFCFLKKTSFFFLASPKKIQFLLSLYIGQAASLRNTHNVSDTHTTTNSEDLKNVQHEKECDTEYETVNEEESKFNLRSDYT